MDKDKLSEKSYNPARHVEYKDGKITNEKPYNSARHVEYNDGKKITNNNIHEGSETSHNYTKFSGEKRKQEIERLIKIYTEKDKTFAYVLNFIFPGAGLLYLGKIYLGILLMLITLIIYIWVRGIGLIIAVFTYNLFSSILLVSNVFEPNSFLTDEDVLNYAPNSIKAFRIKSFRVIKSPFSILKRKNIGNTTKNTKKDEEIYNEFDNYGKDKFNNYKKEINDLKIQYQNKEEVAKKIIKEHFPPPQLTYDRFMGEMDMWGEIFLKQIDSALNIINMASECTEKVDKELNYKLDTSKSIVKKMEELVDELTINLGNPKETNAEEVKVLLTDMQDVIDSVKEYE
jgi:TM2 domain-containing membrane protein YozV